MQPDSNLTRVESGSAISTFGGRRGSSCHFMFGSPSLTLPDSSSPPPPMAVLWSTPACPPFSSYAATPLFPRKLGLITLVSRRRRAPADFRTTPARDSLITRSSADRQRKPGVEDDEGHGHQEDGSSDLGWLPALPHVMIASMANFLFGYHIGVMNGPIEAIAKELGFDGSPFLEGLVVSPTRYRGSFGSLCQIGTCLGIIASLSLDLPSESDPHWWRSLLFIASGFGGVLMLGMQFAAESPRWLCKMERVADAERVIRSLWSKTNVENYIKEIQSVTKNDASNSKASWFDLLVEPHNKVAFIGGSLFILQQFSGINGVLYFSSLTFHDIGITSGSLASLYVGITNFVGSLVALYLMDNQGRKRLLVGSYVGMAFSMFVVALAIFSPMDDDLSHTFSVFGSLMYMFTFAIGAGPVTGLIIPELSSAQMRSKIMAFSFSIHWICNFLVGLYFLELVEKLGVGAVYAAFGSVSLLSAMFAAYFIVETKGRSLEEIEISLNSNTTNRGQ